MVVNYFDPLYGTRITISGFLGEVVQRSVEFRRHEHIRQLVCAYVIPEYSRAIHTRLEHMLGTYYLCKTWVDEVLSYMRALEEIREAPQFVPSIFKEFKVLDALELAAISHDIGHSAFSHLGELVVQEVELELSHDDISSLMLLDELDQYLRSYGLTNKSYLNLIEQSRVHMLSGEKISKVIDGFYRDEREARDVRALAALIIAPASRKFDNYRKLAEQVSSNIQSLSDDDLQLLRLLMNSEFDFDKLDYLNRDASYVGMPYVKPTMFVHFIIPIQSNGRWLLAIEKSEIRSLLIFIRSIMYSTVYNEPHVLAVEEVLKRAWLEACDYFREKFDQEKIFEMWFSTDSDVALLLKNYYNAVGARYCKIAIEMLSRKQPYYQPVLRTSLFRLVDRYGIEKEKINCLLDIIKIRGFIKSKVLHTIEHNIADRLGLGNYDLLIVVRSPRKFPETTVSLSVDKMLDTYVPVKPRDFDVHSFIFEPKEYEEVLKILLPQDLQEHIVHITQCIKDLYWLTWTQLIVALRSDRIHDLQKIREKVEEKLGEIVDELCKQTKQA